MELSTWKILVGLQHKFRRIFWDAITCIPRTLRLPSWRCVDGCSFKMLQLLTALKGSDFFTDCMIHNESISAVHSISSVNGEIDDLLRLWEFFEGIAVSP